MEINFWKRIAMSNKEKKIPKFCVDTNEIYFLADMVFKDTPFYVEAISSSEYRYVEDPFSEFPRLKYFEQNNNFDSQEYKNYASNMRIERTTIKEMLDNKTLFPEVFRGVNRKNLPYLLDDSYLGVFHENKSFNRRIYDRLYAYNCLLKYLKEGKVNMFITDTTLDEVTYAITRKHNEDIKNFMDLSLIKPITFIDKKKYTKYLRKTDSAYKKYRRSTFINNLQEEGENDLRIFAESSVLMLDLVSENIAHFISQNKAIDEDNYEISEEFQKLNYENGCFYYSNLNGEKYIAISPKILTVIDVVKYVKENERKHESLRGLQETEVNPSGLIW